VIFGGVGLVPMWLGLVLGRFLHARRKRALEGAV
jgi:hypothetical protein